MLRRWQRSGDRPADNASVNTELRRHTRDRADTKLMLPTELLEQIHFGFPVHKRPPEPIGATVGCRTGGGQYWPALLGQNSIALPEGDETFILKSFKGKRSGMPLKSHKRGGKSAKCGLSAEQIPVIVARDRQGATTDAVLLKLNRVSIAAALDGVVSPANEFRCDGDTAIVAFARRAGIATDILPMPGKPKPNAPDFHLDNVNAYHGRLKEWLRRFHGGATKICRTISAGAAPSRR